MFFLRFIRNLYPAGKIVQVMISWKHISYHLLTIQVSLEPSE